MDAASAILALQDRGRGAGIGEAFQGAGQLENSIYGALMNKRKMLAAMQYLQNRGEPGDTARAALSDPNQAIFEDPSKITENVNKYNTENMTSGRSEEGTIVSALMHLAGMRSYSESQNVDPLTMLVNENDTATKAGLGSIQTYPALETPAGANQEALFKQGQGLRAALLRRSGFDPVTGAPIPGFNPSNIPAAKTTTRTRVPGSGAAIDPSMLNELPFLNQR